MTKICVVGLGRMGSALARAFLAAGHSVRVWNRSPAKASSLAADGALAFAELPEAIGLSDLVVVNVLDYAASDALLRKTPAVSALGGKTLVQLTSGSPKQAREAHQWAKAHGIAYIDGAIMATPNLIGGDSATILYSGSRAAFDRYRSDLEVLGAPPIFVGEDAGHASVLDIALLTTMWGTLFGALQAIAICRAEGLALERYATYLRSFRAVIDLATDDLVQRAGERRDQADDQTLATLAAHFAAFQHVREVTADRGLSRGLPDAMAATFERAIKAGHRGDDFAVLARFMEEKA